MKIFKFGGASIKDVAHINNVVSIIQQHQNEDLVIIVSAIGETTNYLETVWQAYLNKEDWQAKLAVLQKEQSALIDELFIVNPHDIKTSLSVFYDGLIQFLNANTIEDDSYLYDQIVSIGELTSSFILSWKLIRSEIENYFIYAKELVRTDSTYRAGKVNWETTQQQIKAQVGKGIYVTQGFLGGTENLQNTTLGREGSDFSAAIFANCLDAESVTIWKDVEGVFNADPRIITDTTLIKKLSYEQAILLTYYGAKVIHPKTILPLKEKNITLHVRSYNNLENEGTLISNEEADLPAMFIKNTEQKLLKFKPISGTFNPRKLSDILYLMKETQLPVFFIDYSPICIQVSTNNQAFKLAVLRSNLSDNLVISEEIEVEMGVYYENLENTPPMKNVIAMQDNGKFRLVIGEF